jgi:hypothetical protein
MFCKTKQKALTATQIEKGDSYGQKTIRNTKKRQAVPNGKPLELS